MKKCPQCGMNIRDDVEVCGYCGGEISHTVPARSGAGKSAQGPQRSVPHMPAQKARPAEPEGEPGNEDEEEDGGLSRVLQPGEQILIGSLNVSVKKFLFHAYLTNKRIFLIDTQEKKIRVTAKDIPRETIDDSLVESSENSDPVLVLSVKSADDEIKTMKLVFAQEGADRAGEIEDWITLLHHKEPEAKKPQRAAPQKKEPEPEEEQTPEDEPQEEAPPARRQVAAPVRHDEMHPTRKPPLKEHERQPPVKRLIPLAREPEPEPEPEVQPQRRVQVRTVVEHPVKSVPAAREIPAPARTDTQIVRKPEVHAAVRTAMKNPVQPVRQAGVHPVKSGLAEPVRRPLPEREPAEEVAPVEIPAVRRRTAEEEPAENPQFCHNCGKRLPGEANFCPGCGTRLGQAKTLPSRHATTIPRPVPSPAPAPAHARRVPRIEEVSEDDDEDVPTPAKKPQVKKAPKGSDMTILQKFLRR
jgi:hypothetical protein